MMLSYFLRSKEVANIGILVILLLVVMYYSYYISKTSEKIVHLHEELTTLRTTFLTVSTEYNRLQNKVSQLRRDNLNLELLDERSRSVLGYIHENERLILDTQ